MIVTMRAMASTTHVNARVECPNWTSTFERHVVSTWLSITLRMLIRASYSRELIAKDLVSMASYHNFWILHFASQVPRILTWVTLGVLLQVEWQTAYLRR